MISIPNDVLSLYSSTLAKKSVPISYQHYYKKWLRYYLDFCHKYGRSHSNRESLSHFIKKLQEKHQTQPQQKQAAYAISLYYELLQSVAETDTVSNIVITTGANRGIERADVLKFDVRTLTSAHLHVHTSARFPDISQRQIRGEKKIEENSGAALAQWKKAHADLFAEIKTRHYSPKTLKSYARADEKVSGFHPEQNT